MHVETKARSKQFRKQKHGTQIFFCFRPMMLKQHLCANQLKVPRCVQSWLLENTKKKLKVQSANT